ncbi:MAG TPA: hypothetical protein VNR38_08455 [Ureibacillus sp.]|nr:hypothetical protein [Ureibacillus sp.]
MDGKFTGLLIIVFLIGGLLFSGLKKITPEYHKELFFLLLMIVVNLFTGFIAALAASMPSEEGSSTGPWTVFLIIEGLPFLLFILSFILLVRKLKNS